MRHRVERAEGVADGFIAVAPGGPRIDEPERLLPLVEASREKDLRGYLIVGGQDTRCYEPTMRLAAFLKEQGIAYELETHPDAGHWFPPDFEESLHRGLEFIVGDRKAGPDDASLRTLL